MAITIEDPEVERLARRLAAEQGVSVNEAVARALRARLGEERRQRPSASPASEADVAREVARIQAEIRALPELDRRPGDEILYDEHGLPR